MVNELLTCPRCKKQELRQQVSVYVDAPADCHDLSKKGIRSKRVKILGVGWDLGKIYCQSCGYIVFKSDS